MKRVFVLCVVFSLLVLSLRAQELEPTVLIAPQLVVGCEGPSGEPPCWHTVIHIEPVSLGHLGYVYGWFTNEGGWLSLMKTPYANPAGAGPADTVYGGLSDFGGTRTRLDQIGPAMTGWIQFEFYGATPLVSVQYRRVDGNGDIIASIAVTVEEPAREWLIPARTSDREDLGLALVNTGESPLEISLELIRADLDNGGMITSYTSIVLAPGHKEDFFLKEIFSELPDSNGQGGRDNSGFVRVFAESPFGLTAIQGVYSPSVPGGFLMSGVTPRRVP